MSEKPGESAALLSAVEQEIADRVRPWMRSAPVWREFVIHALQERARLAREQGEANEEAAFEAATNALMAMPQVSADSAAQDGASRVGVTPVEQCAEDTGSLFARLPAHLASIEMRVNAHDQLHMLLELERAREQVTVLQAAGSDLVQELRDADRWRMVREFIAVVDPARGVGLRPAPASDDVMRLSLRILTEEFCELLAASTAPPHAELWRLDRLDRDLRSYLSHCEIKVDLPMLIDATVDTDYSTEAIRVVCGVKSAPFWNMVHDANMKKRGGPVNAYNKVGKPPGWVPPDIVGELRRQGWCG